MPLTKEQKKELVEEVSTLLAGSKLTVIAKYQGTSVKSMQELRKLAKGSDTQVKVIKNRLFKRALAAADNLKEVDSSSIEGQLLYAFNSVDEVAPAQNLARFAKNQPQLEFVAAITSDGQLLGPEEVKALASLPNKEQLRAQLAGTIAAPVSGFVGVLSGNVRGILNILNARSESLS